MKIISAKRTALILALCFLSSVRGALVLSEYFNYDDSELQTGYGSWEDGTNNLKYIAADGPVSFGASGYEINGTLNPTSGGGTLNASVTVPRGAQLSLGQNLSGEVWVSFLLNANLTYTTGASAFIAFNSSTYSSSNPNGQGIGFNFDGTDREIAIFNSGGSAISTGTGVTNNAYQLVIAKLQLNASANDSIDAWVFSNADAVPTSVIGLGVADIESSTLDWGDSFSNVWIGGNRGSSGSGTSTSNFDAIRISNLSGDDGLEEVLTGVAIPEPSSFALMGLAMAGVVFALRLRR